MFIHNNQANHMAKILTHSLPRVPGGTRQHNSFKIQKFYDETIPFSANIIYNPPTTSDPKIS